VFVLTAAERTVASPPAASPSARPVLSGLLICAALAGAVLLLAGVGELLLDWFPVALTIQGDAGRAAVTIDGQTRQVALAHPLQAVRFAAAQPYQREFPTDGSDSTNNFTFDPDYFARIGASVYYRLQAFLRDDSSYSRWQDLTIRNGAGAITFHQARPGSDISLPLPRPCRLTVNLHRVEIPRSIDLLADDGSVIRIDVNRNDKYVRISAIDPGQPDRELAHWYFPTAWQPAAAETAYLVLRSAALALALVLLLLPLAALLPALGYRTGGPLELIVPATAALFVLVASSYVAVALFQKAPHVLDAVSYYFQGKVFAGGALTAPAPPVKDAFPTPFTVVFGSRWFSQYPPGAPLALALGFKIGLPWLVGPVLAAIATLLTFGMSHRQFGRATAMLAALLMAGSPFLLLLAGSFLSHVPAMCFAASFLYATTRYLESPRRRWVVLGAAGLGMTFLTREITAVLYGIAVGCFLVLYDFRSRPTQWRRDLALAGCCLGLFLLVYLTYNWALTGSALLLPRHIFNPTDKYGFGSGIGFYGQHTLGSGLVNTDELLTSLSISLFGWPFAAALALMLMPFLSRQVTRWDALHGALVSLFVLGYAAYFYHGIVFGPRYYLEALPSMVLLTARGFGTLACWVAVILGRFGRTAALGRGHSAALLLCAGLLACNAIYFLPRQVALYQGYSGMAGGGGPALGSFVRQSPQGRVSTLSNAVVVTSDWWLYAVYFAAMNCPKLDCPTVFALAPPDGPDATLLAAFPGRSWFTVRDQDGVLVAEPGRPSPLAGSR